MISKSGMDELSMSKYVSFVSNRYYFDSELAKECLITWNNVISYIIQNNIVVGAKEDGEYTIYNGVEGFVIDDCFNFGKYYLTSDGDALPLKWRVIDKQYDTILAITDMAIDVLPFHNELSGVTWDECDLKDYLNNNLVYDIFSTDELAAFVKTENLRSEKTDHLYDEDGLFLLSKKEALSLFYDDSARCCHITDYALAKKPYMERHKTTCIWWLRDTDVNRRGAYIVANDGSIGMTIGRVNSKIYGIRPACWLNVSALSTKGVKVVND